MSPAAAGSELLVRGAEMVVTMDDRRRVLRGADVLVRDGRIAAVSRVPGARAAALARRGGTVLDAAGAIVLPGLVQSHVHLCQTLGRGLADDLELLTWLRRRVWPLEAALDARTARLSAELGCAELLLGGTTAILDMGTVHHQDEVFDACRRAGLRAVSGKAMMDAGAGVPRGLRETTQASLRESDALRARWQGAAGGRLGYAYAPRFVLSCTEALMRAVAERVAAGARVHTHASENATECRLVRARTGLPNVAYLHRLGLAGPRATLAHCVHVGAGERRLLARAGTHVAHCPSSNLKLASGVADVPALRAAGVPVSLGADGAPCNNNLDAWRELRLCAQLAKVKGGPTALPAREALWLATRGGAAALGLEDEIGSLEVGKRADVVVLRPRALGAFPPGRDVYARLVYAASAADVTDVVVDGRVVVRRGVLRTLDADRLRALAGSAQARLARRAGL
ncbi:MAG TPA: 5'-deoxyadenosine deaminase [Myxococcota bacterium]|nr:5'-deoxyadenosine deaminase [Myxococcota bacterium]